MALQIFSGATNNASGIGLNLGTADSVLVLGFASIASTGFAGISAIGSNQRVQVEGIVAGYIGISMGDNNFSDLGHRVVVGEGGLVTGTTSAISMFCNSAVVVNFGLIEGSTGIRLDGLSGVGVSRVENNGTITASNYGIQGGNGEALMLLNRGLISGNVYSVIGSGLNDTLRNRGELSGDVALGGGNDLYKGRGGLVEGTVFGNAGDDTFQPGANAEIIDGGLDIDLLDFRAEASVRAALDNSFAGTGAARGDTYLNIENLYGSTFGNDVLTGNALDNLLNGFGGKDTLDGGAGSDALLGGKGGDDLTGGLGDDIFYFFNLTETGDRLNDFGNVVGDDDILRVSASGFGGGLVAGALGSGQFQSRTDNQAQDADDRFIHDTSTGRLWFDVNGNAAGGLTLVATLQAGATLAAADFQIF